MREYSRASARFWTGDTGKWLRAQGRDHQIIATYLFTCPMSNMIGLYYLNFATLVDEVGHIDREGALKVLRSLSEGGYSRIDERTETVFVVEMAKHQIGETLSKKDNRHKAAVKLLEQYRKSPLFNDFLDRYGAAYQLEAVTRTEHFQKPLARGLEAPSKPGAGAGEGTGAGRGSGGGAGAGTGSGALGPVDNSAGEQRRAEEILGTDSPPEDPQSRRNGSAERRSGSFEAINDGVSKLLATGVYTIDKPSALAQALHVSTSQVEVAIRQLRDRGRLPAGVAA